MSTAHRPTWDPAQGKETKGGSRQYSARDIASQTKLKFRQPGQGSSSEIAKRDLRAELLAAEAEAKERKRKAEGLPVEASAPILSIENGSVADADDESNKRRKVLQTAMDLDKDDEDSDDDSNKDGSDDDDDDDDEDETAELLRELEKIKRERAEEKARLEQEQNAVSAQAREEEIATSNPLLNLAAALGQAPAGSSLSSKPGTFAVKRRWDDDLIFKNQANSSMDKPAGQFVNDLLRTEFHRLALLSIQYSVPDLNVPLGLVLWDFSV